MGIPVQLTKTYIKFENFFNILHLGRFLPFHSKMRNFSFAKTGCMNRVQYEFYPRITKPIMDISIHYTELKNLFLKFRYVKA